VKDEQVTNFLCSDTSLDDLSDFVYADDAKRRTYVYVIDTRINTNVLNVSKEFEIGVRRLTQVRREMGILSSGIWLQMM
jgi:hypothetical protein